MSAKHREFHGEAPRWRYLSALALMLAALVVAGGLVMDYFSDREGQSPTNPEASAQVQPVPSSTITPPVGPIVPTPSTTSTPGKPPRTVKRSAFLPVVVNTAELGPRQVERLPRLTIGNGVQFPSPIDFNPSTYAWDESSAEPGSSRGVVILTAHAYSQDQTALGNRLAATLDSGNGIEIIGDGKRQRYIVDSRRTYDLESYSKLAGEWLDPDSDALLTLTVCDDYNPATGDWESRIVWFASPLK